MNPYQRASAGNLAIIEPSCERTDLRVRDLVDHAIAVQQASNTLAALEYMKSHGIASHVIERVLLEPERRRNRRPH
jgi:hypothetical protein